MVVLAREAGQSVPPAPFFDVRARESTSETMIGPVELGLVTTKGVSVSPF